VNTKLESLKDKINEFTMKIKNKNIEASVEEQMDLTGAANLKET
jgi:hypothetical protein